MTHVMDGSEVVVADRVFDVGFGAGTVDELLLDNRFVVAFYPSSRRVTYRTDGVAANKGFRSLFWHDPVLAIPTKNESKWQYIRRMCMAIVSETREF